MLSGALFSIPIKLLRLFAICMPQIISKIFPKDAFIKSLKLRKKSPRFLICEF